MDPVLAARDQIVKHLGHRTGNLPVSGEGENDEPGKVVGGLVRSGGKAVD